MMMMLFSRLARRIISPSRNVLIGANGGRSSTTGGGSSVYQSPYTMRQADDINNHLGFLKPYLAATNNNEKHGSSKLMYVSDINFLLSNPRMFPSFFSSHTHPPKNDGKFYPKENKETPKGNNQESKSQEESITEEWLLLSTILLLVFYFAVAGEQKQISFEEFKKKLLEPGLVDHIVISSHSLAKVYVRNSPRNQSTDEGSSITSPAKVNTSQYKYYYDISIGESFEEKLEEAQKSLGIDTRDYVPVTYDAEMVWRKQIRLLGIELSLAGAMWYMLRGGLAAQGFTGNVRFCLIWLSCMMFWFL